MGIPDLPVPYIFGTRCRSLPDILVLLDLMILMVVQKSVSGDHQLRLVVYLPLFTVFFDIQKVVQAGFLNHQK